MGAEEIWNDAENSPVGMCVLAVDDDPICLKLLDTLLRKCHYKVTTTKEARIALKMIREEKDRFDLVISDVHMPDMDGFKLLELVGLEMDLPVIMLSANSDPKLVMKGVTHGACDYLVKPVRIEELRNIWQHVIRRKKFDPENQNRSSDEVKAHQGSGEGYGSSLAENHDNNGKFHRKRKDSEDETVDSGNEYEDSGKQKKIRVNWTPELHSQFIAAVNQLGIEKAVPKRILDMMKVEGLTRENVASHLQKYRLGLRKIASQQQANIAAAPGVKDTRFMHMSSSDGYGDFRPSFASKLYNGEFSPYTNNGMLSQLNSFSNVDLRNLTPRTLVWPSRAQNLSNSISSLGRMHLVCPNSTQNPSVFQEIPSSIELDQLQQNEVPSNFNRINNSRIFRTGNVLVDTRAALGSSNPLMLHGDAHLPLNGEGFVNQSTHDEAPFTSESFNAGFCSDNWHNSVKPSKIHPIDLSPGMALLPFEDSREMQCQYWAEQRGNHAHSFHIPTNGIMPNLDQSNDILNEKMDMYINGRSSGSGPDLMQQNPDREVVIESRLRSNEDSLFEQPMLQGGFSPQGYDTLDELTNALIIPVDDSFMEYFAESGLHHHRL